MDNAAKGLAQKIISELESIKRLIVNAISNPQKEHDGAQGNQRQSHGGESEAAPRIHASPSKTQPSIACKYEAETKNKSRFPRLAQWKPVIELVGLIVLTTYTTLTAMQWAAVLRSNKISQDQLTVSTRPWVALDGPPKVITPLSFDDQGIAHLAVSVAVKNAGNSPSLRTAIITNIVFEPGDSTMSDLRMDLSRSQRTAALYKCDAQFADFMEQNEAGKIMLPQASEEAPFEFPNQYIAPLRRPPGKITSKFAMFLIGCISYRDQFGNKHGTSFVANYRSGNQTAFVLNGTIEGALRPTDIGTTVY